MNTNSIFTTYFLAISLICPFFSIGQTKPYFGYCEIDLSVDIKEKEQAFKKVKHSIESGTASALNENMELLTINEMNYIFEENEVKNFEKINLKSIVVWDIDSSQASLFAFKIIKSKASSPLFSVKGDFEQIFGKDLFHLLRQKTVSNFLKKANISEVNEVSSVLKTYEQKNHSIQSISNPDNNTIPDSLTYRFLPYSDYNKLYLGKIQDFNLMIDEFFRDGLLTPYKSEKLVTPLTYTGYESLKKSDTGKVSKLNDGIIITENWLIARTSPHAIKTNSIPFNTLFPLLKKEVHSLGILINKHRFWINYKSLKSYLQSASFRDYNNSKYSTQFEILEMIIKSSFCERIDLQLDLS